MRRGVDFEKRGASLKIHRGLMWPGLPSLCSRAPSLRIAKPVFIDLPIARQDANLALCPLGFVWNPMFPQDDMTLSVAPRRTQDRREGMQRHRGANPMMVKLLKDRSADRPLVASPPLAGPITPAIPYPNLSVEAALRSALSHRTDVPPGTPHSIRRSRSSPALSFPTPPPYMTAMTTQPLC